MTKMTYVEALSNALSLLDSQVGNGFDDFDLQATIEKLTALKAQTEKRNTADRKPTKTQVANVGLQDKILAVMTAVPATVTEIMSRDAELAALSNQKVAALIRGLVDMGKVVRSEEKRVAKFARV